MAFRDVIGHDRQVELLRTMIASERLPHALLMTGPAGVGRRTLALAAARAVNCLDPREGEACGVCSACDKIGRGVHPDVQEFEPEGRQRRIKIDTVRELRREVGYRPYEGRVKVFILREADRLSAGQGESANALLKTLEEPPDHSLLILIAPGEAELPPTVVSRCLRVHLAPLPLDRVEEWLAENRGLTGPRARLLAASSGGCLGRVVEADPDRVWELREQVSSRLESLDPARPASAAAWAEELAGDPETWPEVMDMIRIWYRDLMVLTGGGGEKRLAAWDMADRMKEAAAGRRAEEFMAALAEVDRTEDALARLIRPDLVWTNLFLALADVKRG